MSGSFRRRQEGFASEVAEEAGGRSLPPWVGYAHPVGWVLIVVILILNWKYAIALCAAMFLLKVIPVLERIGAWIMSPFLQAADTGSIFADDSQESEIDQLDGELTQIEDAIYRKETELVDKKIEIEREIHSLKPGSKSEEFVPPFHIWSQYPEIQELDFEDAMDYYIERFQLQISEEDRKRFDGCAFLEKGRAQYVEKRFEDALANLDRAIECGIGDEAYAMRADCLQALDYHLEAIEDYDRAILQEPEDCNLRFLRSCSKNAICDDEGALIDLQEAIELSKIDNELNRSYAAVARESGYQGHTALYEMDLIKAKSDKNMDEELRQELRRRKLARNSKRRKK
ncbi:MAG: hypothetical protein KAW46_11740 [candidate division Zixibacteria bacterium]|nr:hypothetical protein [candidate division Zixibacteria bacterium]